MVHTCDHWTWKTETVKEFKVTLNELKTSLS